MTDFWNSTTGLTRAQIAGGATALVAVVGVLSKVFTWHTEPLVQERDALRDSLRVARAHADTNYRYGIAWKRQADSLASLAASRAPYVQAYEQCRVANQQLSDANQRLIAERGLDARKDRVDRELLALTTRFENANQDTILTQNGVRMQELRRESAQLQERISGTICRSGAQ